MTFTKFPEMLKILRQVQSRPCTVQMVRPFTTSSLPQKKLDLTPESDVILLTGQEKSQTTIKYSELLEKVGKKNLVKVTKSKMKRDLPLFQLMSDVELEIAMRKEKSHSASWEGVRTSYGNYCEHVLMYYLSILLSKKYNYLQRWMDQS